MYVSKGMKALLQGATAAAAAAIQILRIPSNLGRASLRTLSRMMDAK